MGNKAINNDVKLKNAFFEEQFIKNNDNQLKLYAYLTPKEASIAKEKYHKEWKKREQA